MKRVLLIFLIVGCIGQEEWTFYVIDETVTEYTLGDIGLFEIDAVYETVIEKEIKKVKWEGVSAHQFGEGDTINFISEDGYLVSIPYDVKVLVAYKKDGDPIDEKEGGPVKIAVDPYYGCKCNWLKYLKIVEFVHAEDSLSVYGDVVNMLTFSPRDVNLYYGFEDVMNNTYREVPLTFILDKALCKENATRIVFITEEGRYSFLLSEIRDMDLILVYDSGFQIHGLGITKLRGIKIE